MTVTKPQQQQQQQQAHPLISNHPSTSGLKIALHPLALLTISDYVTRHTLRGIGGPIVGALLGSQKGREITIEHAYEIKLVDDSLEGGMEVEGEKKKVHVDEGWFNDKLKQFKDVHPTLDFVGHFTLLPPPPRNQPSQVHLDLQDQLQQFNESLVFLGLHPSPLSTSEGGKLPLTIWESTYEEQGEGDTKELKMKFIELDYFIETGEAEMIGVDGVARGTGNAGDETGGSEQTKKEEVSDSKDKGKGKGGDAEGDVKERTFELPIQTQELISNLTAKANAIRMLHQRLGLLVAYLQTLPQSEVASGSSEKLNHPVLRSLLSLTTRLPLLTPPAGTLSSLEEESLAEQSDVHLVALLGMLTHSVDVTREVGRKFAVVDNTRHNQARHLQAAASDFANFDPEAMDWGSQFGVSGGRAGIINAIGGFLKGPSTRSGRRF